MDYILKTIKQEMESRKWGVNRLGEESGISNGTISKILNGKQPLSMKVIRGVAKAFDWPIEMLMVDPNQAAPDLKRLVAAVGKLSKQNRAILIALALEMLKLHEREGRSEAVGESTRERRRRRART